MAGKRKNETAFPVSEAAVRGGLSEAHPAAARTAPSDGWSRRPAAAYWVVALLACLVFLNTLPNDFVYDDIIVVRKNTRIHSLANWSEIWLTDWWYYPPEQTEERHRDRLYRPLVMQTFAINYALSGLRTWSYHLFNVALHAVTCVSIVALTRRLFGDLRLAAWTGLLFAVLPVHTESVANIVGRADLMGALFCVLGVLCLAHELRAARAASRLAWRAGAILCLALGLLSKEQAVCLPGLLLLVEWYLRRRGLVAACARPTGRRRAFLLRRFGGFYLWVGLTVVGYLVLRYICLEYHLVRDVPPASLDNSLSAATVAQRLWAPFLILAQYLLVTVWPANLCCDYSFNSLPLSAWPADLKTLGGVLLTIAAVWASLRSARRGGAVLFIILFFACSYALISNSFLVIGTIMGERLFYLPSLPVCWLIVIGLRDLHAHLLRTEQLAGPGLRLAPTLAYAVLLVLALRTALRCSDWRNPEVLFAADVQVHPQSARLQLFMARILIERKEYDAALERLEKSLAIYPEYANAQANLGLIHALAGDWATAKKYYLLARQLLWENPALQVQYEQFRRLYEEGVGSPEADLLAVQQAATTQPHNLELQLRLADLQAGLGRYREGIATLQAVRQRGCTQREVTYELAALLIIDEQYDQAQTLLEELLARDENDWQSHSQLAILLAYTAPQASLRHARRAVEIAPLLFEPRMNLVQALVVNRRYPEAMQELRTLHQMIPPGEPARGLVERQMRIVKDRL